jgi:hypothetical protein
MAKRPQDGKGTKEPRAGPRGFIVISGILLLAGCSGGGQQVDDAMRADKGGVASRNVPVAARYFVGCPDVVEVRIDGRPETAGEVLVGI